MVLMPDPVLPCELNGCYEFKRVISSQQAPLPLWEKMALRWYLAIVSNEECKWSKQS